MEINQDEQYKPYNQFIVCGIDPGIHGVMTAIDYKTEKIFKRPFPLSHFFCTEENFFSPDRIYDFIDKENVGKEIASMQDEKKEVLETITKDTSVSIYDNDRIVDIDTINMYLSSLKTDDRRAYFNIVFITEKLGTFGNITSQKGISTSGIIFGQLLPFLHMRSTFPIYQVHPSTWKSEYGLIKKEKDESIKVATQMIKDRKDEEFKDRISYMFYCLHKKIGKKEKQDLSTGMADSYLIAQFLIKKIKEIEVRQCL